MSFQILKTKCKFTEKVFIIVLGVSLLLLLFTTKFVTTPVLTSIAAYTILLVAFLLLLYISYIDFKSMEIEDGVSLALMLLLLGINLFLHFTIDLQRGLVISDRFTYIPYENFLLALILGVVFFLIVSITKEKAMGSGDIRIAIIIGLLIGYRNVMPWLYITVFSALIYGLILGYKNRKWRNLMIPFVPFMVLGALTVLLIDMFI